ncbi:MAG: hypothetical protein HQ532_02670 [Candidatus Omnitrophica bacterium]|nr:hypothetical protein [Candidatus Omnitrophota bacterium]
MNKTSNNKGVALFLSLSLLILLSIVSVVVLLTSYNYASFSEGQIKRLKALSLAESGIHYAYWKVRIGEDDNGEDINFDDGNTHTLHPSDNIPGDMAIEVAISGPGEGGRKTIRSTVTY